MPLFASPLQQQVHVLYESHHGWLNAWLRRRLDCHSMAADIAHDTFLRILASQRTFRAGDEPRALLTHIAKGLVIDHWRRREVERAYLATIACLPPAVVPGPEARLAILETLEEIDLMLATLPARTREMFLLAQLDGLSYAEVARRCKASLPTVKRHMRRAFLACLTIASPP